jgi:hypothetical protein
MPLPMTDFDVVRSSFDMTISMLGVPAQFTRADGTGALAMVVGFASPNRNDINVVNAYGIEAKIVTISAKSSPGPTEPPAKFDVLVIGGKRFVAQAVHDVLLNAELVGWKLVVTGGR